MIYTELTKKALALSFAVHKEQLDKGGAPYPYHPFYLASRMRDEEGVICALLHDVLEDSDLTADDLRGMGYPDTVIDALCLLCHDPETDYFDYIRAIAENPVARRVKLLDLRHNSDLSRLAAPTAADHARAAKYKKAIGILKRGKR